MRSSGIFRLFPSTGAIWYQRMCWFVGMCHTGRWRYDTVLLPVIAFLSCRSDALKKATTCKTMAQCLGFLVKFRLLEAGKIPEVKEALKNVPGRTENDYVEALIGVLGIDEEDVAGAIAEVQLKAGTGERSQMCVHVFSVTCKSPAAEKASAL